MSAFAPKKIKGKSPVSDNKGKAIVDKEAPDVAVSATARKQDAVSDKKFYRPSDKKK